MGPRFGTKIKSISRYGLNFYLQLKKKKKKKDYSSSHSKCHSILNAEQEPITCAD